MIIFSVRSYTIVGFLVHVKTNRIFFLSVLFRATDLRSPQPGFPSFFFPGVVFVFFLSYVDFLIVDILTAVKTTTTQYTQHSTARDTQARASIRIYTRLYTNIHEALLLYWYFPDTIRTSTPCCMFSIHNKKKLTTNGGCCCCCCCTINPHSVMKFPVAGWQSYRNDSMIWYYAMCHAQYDAAVLATPGIMRDAIVHVHALLL